MLNFIFGAIIGGFIEFIYFMIMQTIDKEGDENGKN